jgi:hypothetical protein
MGERDGNKGQPLGSERKRKIYAARLRELGLPANVSKIESCPPSQLELAQLAAILGHGSKEPATELAANALQLWNASGRALVIQEQVEIVVNGLPFFDRKDWEKHAGDLVSSFNDGVHAPPGHKDRDEFKAEQRAAERASAAVWDRWLTDWSLGRRILAALFPGKGETARTRAEKAKALAEYGLGLIRAEMASDFHKGKSESDVMKWMVARSWAPLRAHGVFKEDMEWEYVKIRLDDPAAILIPEGWCMMPLASRWFIELRMKQVSVSKARRSR